MEVTRTAFDGIASTYDDVWTRSPVGRSQRNAVWRRLDPLFQRGDTILDLGCGTGEDAVHFMRNGVNVVAIDSSAGMVRRAIQQGVDATEWSLEELDRLDGSVDAAMSNFGAFNCVADVASLRAPLARLILPGGYLAICVIGRVCLWETLWYLLKGQPHLAFRRWVGESCSNSLGLKVYYPDERSLRQAFAKHFELRRWFGVGLLVPPSYVTWLPQPIVRILAFVDRQLAHFPGLRALADHRLFIFVRR